MIEILNKVVLYLISGKSLTARELEILILIALNFTTAMIADKLNISEDTVKTHRKNAFKKIDCHNEADVVSFVLNNNYCTQEQINEARHTVTL